MPKKYKTPHSWSLNMPKLKKHTRTRDNLSWKKYKTQDITQQTCNTEDPNYQMQQYLAQNLRTVPLTCH